MDPFSQSDSIACPRYPSEVPRVGDRVPQPFRCGADVDDVDEHITVVPGTRLETRTMTPWGAPTCGELPGQLGDRSGVEVVQLLAALPLHGHQARGLEYLKMLGHGLTRHGQVRAELFQGLPVAVAEPRQKRSPVRVGQCLEDRFHVVSPICNRTAALAEDMQPHSCMSTHVGPLTRYMAIPPDGRR